MCTILTLGLWPFHSPKNGVTWLGNHNGLRFGRYSTVISSGSFQVTPPGRPPEGSFEIWLQPYRIWDSGTLLTFYKHGDLFQFSLQQDQTDLLLRTLTEDGQHRTGTERLRLKEVFRKLSSVFITITSGVNGASIYIDGALASAYPHAPVFAGNFNGLAVLGDSPGQNDSWRGQLWGFAIYGKQLSAAQVYHNYATWKQTGRPEPIEDVNNVALYLFDERSGRVVRDKGRSGVDFYIPETYLVLDKIVLEPFWTEFSMTRSYWGAALKNIVGFIPVGFCFYAYLSSVLPRKRAVLFTVALGTAISLTIEILQAFLPTRESGTTDLITNTLGTVMGVVSYRLLTPILARLFPWLPLPVEGK